MTAMKREIHVDHGHGMWWAMPHWLSDDILETWTQGSQQVSFVWDWGTKRKGSYYGPDGEETPYNRYVIDFDTMKQCNSDNGRTRQVKVVGIICE